jgi:hypothetical protein
MAANGETDLSAPVTELEWVTLMEDMEAIHGKPEGQLEKMKRKTKENPLVPVGESFLLVYIPNCNKFTNNRSDCNLFLSCLGTSSNDEERSNDVPKNDERSSRCSRTDHRTLCWRNVLRVVEEKREGHRHYNQKQVRTDSKRSQSKRRLFVVQLSTSIESLFEGTIRESSLLVNFEKSNSSLQVNHV